MELFNKKEREKKKPLFLFLSFKRVVNFEIWKINLINNREKK